MSGKASRDKGHGFERKIAGRMRGITGGDIWREYESRTGKGYDVEVYPFLIQAKAYKTYQAVTRLFEPVLKRPYKQKEWKTPQALAAALRRGRKDTPDLIPVLFNKADHLPTTVTMFEDDWYKMFEVWVKHQEQPDDNLP